MPSKHDHPTQAAPELRCRQDSSRSPCRSSTTTSSSARSSAPSCLKRASTRFHYASDGLRGLETLHDVEIDIALADYEMPLFRAWTARRGPRPFVKSTRHFGADRRRRIDPSCRSPLRRASDGEAALEL